MTRPIPNSPYLTPDEVRAKLQAGMATPEFQRSVRSAHRWTLAALWLLAIPIVLFAVAFVAVLVIILL